MRDPHSEGPLVPQSIVLQAAACSVSRGQGSVCLSNLRCRTCSICPSSSFLGHPQHRVSPGGMWIVQKWFPKRKACPHTIHEVCYGPPARVDVHWGTWCGDSTQRLFFQVLAWRGLIPPFPPWREECCGDQLYHDSCRLLWLWVGCSSWGDANLNRRHSASFWSLSFGPKALFMYFKSNPTDCLICLWLQFRLPELNT